MHSTQSSNLSRTVASSARNADAFEQSRWWRRRHGEEADASPAHTLTPTGKSTPLWPRRVSATLQVLEDEARRIRSRLPEVLRQLAFSRQPELLALERTHAQLSIALLTAKAERTQYNSLV